MKFRWWMLGLLVLLVIGVARLRFDADVLDLLPGNVRSVAGLKIYQQHFANARELIVTVTAGDAESAKSAAGAIANSLRRQSNEVADVTWQAPWLEHPEQTTELIAFLWLNQPPALFHQLAEQLSATNLNNVLTATRDELSTTLSAQEIARLGYDPFGLTRLPDKVMASAGGFGQGDQIFSSADGTFRLIFVKATTDLPGYRECTQWFDDIKSTVAAAAPAGGIKIGYTGRPAFVAEISASMRRDITLSVGGTSIIIAVLFWLAHRRIKPMLWLLTLLALILAATLALGGLVFGTVSVVSMGFAAVLLGLAVDYAVVHYQEALAHPELSVPEVRRAIAPGIFWAAVTTISSFLVLNFGGLPGLAQLGSLVGIGVMISACVMIFAFLPPLFPDRMKPSANRAPHPAPSATTLNPLRTILVIGATTGLLLVCVVVLIHGWPGIDSSADALQPRDSQAYNTLTALKKNLGQQHEPIWLVVEGRDEGEVARRLDAIEPALENATSNSVLTGFTSPVQMWPRPDFQNQNRADAQKLVSERAALHTAATTNGFADSALGLADGILDHWRVATATTNVDWPTNALSAWILEKFAVRDTNHFLAAAFLYPAAKSLTLAQWETRLGSDGVWISSWELLGETVLASVTSNLWKLVLPMVGLALLSLGLAFRRWTEVLLSLAVLGLSGLCLLAVMRLAGWQWNLLNLMALPLILGTGMDYGIFMQLALRRCHGDLRLAHRSVGRALLLCGGTAIAGFGSLGMSSNLGMASLGRVCAVGIAANMGLSVLLLPVWWRLAVRRTGAKAPPAAPSSLYRAGFWRIGLWSAQIIPPWLGYAIARLGAGIYWTLAKERREVVIGNLLPVFNHDRVAAKRAARELFTEFALKLADLWRHECSVNKIDWFKEWNGWENYNEPNARGRGVLLVTPHLGNWELGSVFMARKGSKLVVLTMPEPDPRLTEIRQAARARWGVETLVVGADAFGFIEIIKRLQAGATIALLLDRPPPPTGVEITLFNQPFTASIAAAELARASGCAILPTFIVRREGGYRAMVLPEIPYDRATIGDRASRIKLTQEVLRAFEPVIRQYPTQWFHFVPIWPKK